MWMELEEKKNQKTSQQFVALWTFCVMSDTNPDWFSAMKWYTRAISNMTKKRFLLHDFVIRTKRNITPYDGLELERSDSTKRKIVFDGDDCVHNAESRNNDGMRKKKKQNRGAKDERQIKLDSFLCMWRKRHMNLFESNHFIKCSIWSQQTDAASKCPTYITLPRPLTSVTPFHAHCDTHWSCQQKSLALYVLCIAQGHTGAYWICRCARPTYAAMS